MKTFLRDISKPTIIALLPVLITLALSGCSSDEWVKQKAYDHVLEELKTDGHPTGMFGVTWYMTQQDVNKIHDDLYQLIDDALAHEKVYCERSVRVSYHFRLDDRLSIIIVTFMDDFSSLDKFSDAFYEVQNCLSSEYGQMPDSVMHEIIPPADGVWKDQMVLESSKQMGRISLIHRISIQDNALGEQIIMFLGKKEG